jgi:hypothetical protein
LNADYIVLEWCFFGPNNEFWQFGPKMAETSSSGPSIAHARFGSLEMVSAIFIEVKLILTFV